MSIGDMSTARRLQELVTPDEVAAFFRISKTSVYRLVERRALPFHRVSGLLRFARSDLEAYVRAGRVEPMDPQRYL